MNQLVLLLAGGLLVALGFYMGLRRRRLSQGVPDVTPLATAPRIVRQPLDIRMKQGELVVLEAHAEGTEPLAYQWFRDDQPIHGATESYLETQATLGALQLLVKNARGEVRSRLVQVCVLVPPVIQSEPEPVSILAGEDATFSVQVAAASGATFQWHRNGAPIPGATESTLILPEVSEEDHAAEFQVTISNEAGVVQSKPASLNVRLTRLISGDPNHPELELSRWEGMPEKTREIRMTSSLKSRMAMMIQPGVNLAEQGRTAATAFKVVFSPEVTQGLREGTFKMMSGSVGKYATAVDKGHKIVGNGQLVVNNAARAMAIGTAVFQVLAVVTAQKFLADIDKKLATIGDRVKDIQNWQEEEAWGTLRAGHDYLNGIAQAIHEQRLSHPEVTVFLNQLEHIDRDSQRIARMTLKRLQRLENALPKITKSLGSTGVKDDAEKLQGKLDEWGFYAHGLMGALRLRGAAAQLRCSLPVNPGPSNHRLGSLKECLGEMQSVQDSFTKEISLRADGLISRVSKDESASLKHQFLDQTRHFTREFQAVRQEMHDTIQAIQEGLGEMDVIEKSGVALIVTLDEQGEVASLAQIEEQSA